MEQKSEIKSKAFKSSQVKSPPIIQIFGEWEDTDLGGIFGGVFRDENVSWPPMHPYIAEGRKL